MTANLASSMTPAQLARQDHRNPDGTYRSVARNEAEIELMPADNDITRRGTFHFAPEFKDADEVIDFYTRVEVPDDVLIRSFRTSKTASESLNNAIAELRTQKVNEAYSARLEEWKQANKKLKPLMKKWEDIPEYAEFEQALRQEVQATSNADYGVKDPVEPIHYRDITPVVRALQMRRACGDERFQEVGQHEMDLGWGTMTVAEIVDTYGLDEVNNGLDYRDPTQQLQDQILAELRALRQEVNDQRGRLGEIQGEQDQVRIEREIAQGLRDVTGRRLSKAEMIYNSARGR